MAKKMSQDEFIEKSISIHSNRYDYSKTIYKGKRNKVIITCPIHGDFEQLPSNHLRGQGCPLCSKEKISNKHKGGFETYVKKFNSIHGEEYAIPYIDTEYENKNSIITCICNNCGTIYKKKAYLILTDKIICKCRNKSNALIDYKTLKQYENSEYKFIPFEGLKDKNKETVTCVCDKHGEFKRKINNIISKGYTCQKCKAEKNKKKQIPFETIKEHIENKYPSIEMLENTAYVGTNSKTVFRCKECGSTFYRKPNLFLSKNKLKTPCPNCTKDIITKERTKTTDEYISDVEEKYGMLKYCVIGSYASSSDKILIRCNDCGRTFEIEANSFLHGHGCPYHNCNSSLKEKEMFNFIKGICDDAVNNDRTILEGNELDVYIPSKQIAFEFDGIFWHNENNKSNDYHIIKTIACNNKDIRLIHVFEDEWRDKKEIWKSMITNILGVTQNRIFARKCIIKYVETNEATVFLKSNHIQGWCPSQIKLGLYYNDELVSLMTFGKSRHFVGNGETQYELLRFCNKINTTVVGGASKLFKHFLKEYDPLSIVSYADRRWSKGNLYDKLNFTLTHFSKPNYYYVIKDKRKNRFNFRKRILTEKYNCPKNMSERNFCKFKKWYRIYDCGCAVYKWFKNDGKKN